MLMRVCATVEEYVEGLPEEVRGEFGVLRESIRKLVPEGEEVIRYGIPTIRLAGKNLVHFAAMKKHFGFYPAPSAVRAFAGELLGKYSFAKGVVRFPIDRPLPLSLIRRMVKFRLKEERDKKRPGSRLAPTLSGSDSNQKN